ncbi:hypothetical protein [Pedobacter sp. NJ-S-72]
MKRNKFALLFALIAFASFTWSFKEDLFLVSKNLDIFASLYKEISVNYVDETNPTDLMKNGIDACWKRWILTLLIFLNLR